MTVTINGTTGVSGVAGSASTPALIGSDADSGYYINSANEPNASVNGTAVWSAASTFGFKNRIINGAMMIDQRNAGASVTINSSTELYAVDRTNCYGTGSAGVFTAQRSTVAPAGFINSLLCTVTTSSTPSGGNEYGIRQVVEGFNIADLGWGAAGAASITLSFWVRSSLTGTFAGSVTNNGYARSYVFTYTISAANTWEYKTVTIAGDTSGTWSTDNGAGIRLQFNLGAGSSKTGTAGVWSAGYLQSATSSVNLIATNGATFYITGVQLEKGSTATSFDYRPYGTELALCQRYFQFGQINAEYAAGSTGTLSTPIFSFPVSMRSTPTFAVISTGGSGNTVNAYNSYSRNGVVFAYSLNLSVTTTGYMYRYETNSLSAEL